MGLGKGMDGMVAAAESRDGEGEWAGEAGEAGLARVAPGV
jgi:hypothetical protein